MANAPTKTRDIHNHHMDSTVWDDFAFRDDDIVIATYAKSGTTWMQQIISQLIFDGAEDLPVSDMSPWIDLRIPPREVKLPALEAQEHRRFVKTHLPVDALVFSQNAKYIYVARDARDVMWSLYNHHAKANELWYDAINNTPGRVGPEIGEPGDDVVAYFENWLNTDGQPYWSFWENLRSWWEIRDLPNVKMVHFSDMKADLAGQVAEVAEFLDIAVSPELMEKVLEHSSFHYMKNVATGTAPAGGMFWDGGQKTFINKGINGRWKDMLSEETNAQYLAMAEAELGAQCATWLRDGSQP